MGLTCQQTNYIFYIEKLLDVKFHGETFEEANLFIRENLPKAVEKFEANKARFKYLMDGEKNE